MAIVNKFRQGGGIKKYKGGTEAAEGDSAELIADGKSAISTGQASIRLSFKSKREKVEG